MALMISWVMRLNPSHPYLENDPAPSFAPTICAFHLGFSLGHASIYLTDQGMKESLAKKMREKLLPLLENRMSVTDAFAAQ